MRASVGLRSQFGRAHALIGKAKSLMGRSEETEAHINEALRLCPRHHFAHYTLLIAGAAKLQLSADVEAVDWLQRSIETNCWAGTGGVAKDIGLGGLPTTTPQGKRATSSGGLLKYASATTEKFLERRYMTTRCSPIVDCAMCAVMRAPWS